MMTPKENKEMTDFPRRITRWTVATIVSAALAGVIGTSAPTPSAVHAQTVVHGTLLGCGDATAKWHAQDQWALGWLTLAFHRHGVSPEAIGVYYTLWTASFGVDGPCDGTTLSTAVQAQVTSERATAFSDCLRNGIENRRWAVQKFTEHYVSAAASGGSLSEVQTSLDASREYVRGLARTAGLRTCRW
jgi:hypothetical protein